MRPRSRDNPNGSNSTSKETREPSLGVNNDSRKGFKPSRQPKRDKRENPWKQKSAFQKAMEQFKQKKDDKIKQRQDQERIRKEKAAALERYKKEKREKFAKLSKKTRKGQPVMKHRLELLLERIKNTVGSSGVD